MAPNERLPSPSSKVNMSRAMTTAQGKPMTESYIPPSPIPRGPSTLCPCSPLPAAWSPPFFKRWSILSASPPPPLAASFSLDTNGLCSDCTFWRSPAKSQLLQSFVQLRLFTHSPAWPSLFYSLVSEPCPSPWEAFQSLCAPEHIIWSLGLPLFLLLCEIFFGFLFLLPSCILTPNRHSPLATFSSTNSFLLLFPAPFF